MKEVLAHIENKKQEFAKMPLFEYMKDTSIDPRQRLAWAPCAAPFAMGFAELNRDVFRDEQANDPIQKVINQHTCEDDHHWLWFLKDIERLEMNKNLKFTDALTFLWSEETRIPRSVIYELYKQTFKASPIHKLVVIEVIEATGNILNSATALVTKELQNINGKNLLYFGDVHLSVEPGYVIGIENIDKFIKEITLTQQEMNDYFDVVNQIFDLFIELTNALLIYAKKHEIKQLAQSGQIN
ncbi:MAG: hypothetical protein KI793_16765 [Rivularia sp. (in: Bacteria)]|nr:hypothetical protein [Rivularia sp. MS3]